MESGQHLLATTVPVTWPPTGIFTEDIFSLLDSMIEERLAETEAPEVIVVEEKGKAPDLIID